MFCTSIQHGSQNDFNFLFNKAKATNDTSLRNDMFAGLTCSKDVSNLNKYLNDQMNTSSIITAIRNVLNKPSGNLLAWNFIKNNWNNIYDRYYLFLLFFKKLNLNIYFLDLNLHRHCRALLTTWLLE